MPVRCGRRRTSTPGAALTSDGSRTAGPTGVQLPLRPCSHRHQPVQTDGTAGDIEVRGSTYNAHLAIPHQQLLSITNYTYT